MTSSNNSTDLNGKVENMTIDDKKKSKSNIDESSAMEAIVDTDFDNESSSSSTANTSTSTTSTSYKGKNSAEVALKAAIDKLHQDDLKAKEADKLREKELASLTNISSEDVDFISTEFEISKDAADRALRIANGDFEKCVETLLTT